MGKCQRLATDNALVAEYRVADKDNLKRTHSDLLKEFGGKNRPFCIVYDTELFSYQDILNVFAEQPQQNIHIGFYHRKENRVVTMMEVIGD